ncbi:haloacid dehalogenase type II [Ostreiculturibacter nitratireducens]|uniref:haloacid dehalogenase type II n=1 Tax=Ostreiculturibacter nitratireducens TaxID=3075226 RepID=UPI0031B60CE5
MPIKVCVFDAYGTLFDVAAAARIAAAEPGHEALAAIWPRLAEDWRTKQLQYTWLRAVMGEHADFWQVTQDGLDWAMEAQGLSDPDVRARLLALYRELAAYPEVPDMLAHLKSDGFATAILSNGSPDMLDAAVASAGIGGNLDAVLSVESVGVFKPHPSVYCLVTDHFGCERAEVLFVSSNGWDAAAAAAYGFTTVWANRKGEPVDRLTAEPDYMVSDLTTVPELAKR